jgi:hypothetical protein
MSAAIGTQMQVTVCLTSCGRQDLLEHTIKSFYYFNTYPITRFIVSEDSGIKGINTELQAKYPQIDFINDGIKHGQIKSIDSMYKQVTTPYIFHCEDDWQFYRKGFIEESLSILTKHHEVLTVWLRAKNDTNGHPFQWSAKHNANKVKTDFRGWHGFTFNPTLKRLSDYHRIGSYSELTTFDPENPAKSEKQIGHVYKDLGYIALLSKQPYVKHIGWNRTVK